MYSSVKKDDALRQITDEIRVGINLREMSKLAMIWFAPEATGILLHVSQHEIPTGSLLVPIRSLHLRAHSKCVHNFYLNQSGMFFSFFERHNRDVVEFPYFRNLDSPRPTATTDTTFTTGTTDSSYQARDILSHLTLSSTPVPFLPRKPKT